MLRIDKCRYTAGLLCLGDGVYGESGLTRALGAVYLYDAALGVTAHAEGGIKADAARGYHVYVLYLFVTEFHYRPLAEVFLYLCHGGLKGFELAFLCRGLFFCLSHKCY